MSSFPRMHVSLYVSNLAETVDFYNTFFGQRPEKIRKGYTKYLLEKPALIISFIENPERVRSGFGHLGFQVETKAEMESRLAVARREGIVSREEIGTACCFAIQDKFWVNDPDGHQWEIYFFHEDAEFNDPRYDTTEAQACCTAPAETEAVQFETVNLPIVEGSADANTCTPGSGCC